ncbi:hypothetical protein Acr_03g0010770 [Actinidia rufa]|uniref:Uncharacterized protein n=1 Tax=Actinidia rufa TaxID=165716 RepID=A0A7J0ECV2_9ERIC|nr:hypothetical protein Acr_03g0010770 [Actinidia rufa]
MAPTRCPTAWTLSTRARAPSRVSMMTVKREKKCSTRWWRRRRRTTSWFGVRWGGGGEKRLGLEVFGGDGWRDGGWGCGDGFCDGEVFWLF